MKMQMQKVIRYIDQKSHALFSDFPFSGYIAEHTNLRVYLSIGMWLTGLLTCLFGMAFFWNIHTTSFFFLVQVRLHDFSCLW